VKWTSRSVPQSVRNIALSRASRSIASVGVGLLLLYWAWVWFSGPDFERVQVGMTVEQVEAILGKPNWVQEYTPSEEHRGYSIGRGRTMIVWFKNGRAAQIEQRTSRPWFQVGRLSFPDIPSDSYG
jgi:hypothetical protein